MKIIRARVSGFCMGVRRAVNMAYEAALLYENVFTLGPLIHNNRVLKNLEQKRIRVLEEDQIRYAPKNPAVIIRAHGIPPEVEKCLVEQGLKVLDATCPHVKASQKKALEYSRKGYDVILAGDNDHAEIKGIRGYAEANLSESKISGFCHVAGNAEEAEAVASKLKTCRPDAKTVLIGQTTIAPEKYSEIAKHIQGRFPDLETLDTICNSTAERQNALRELCGITDAVIIAGSKESANSKNLFSLARDLGKPCWLIESVDEIPPDVFNYKTLGIAAGASAPEDLMDEIESVLMNKPH